MSTRDEIRIGFIGAGAICRTRHLPNLQKIDGVKVQVVCNRSEESSRKVASDFDIPEVESDWRNLVAREDLDAVFIGTWPYMHKEMSVAVLEAGKHVFCQARMASTLDDARAMVEAAKKHRTLVNMICPPPHRMPWEPYIRDVLASGKLGELRDVRLVCVDSSNLGDLTWRERVEFSGQQVMQVGIWAETLHAWVGEYDELAATTATPITSKRDEAGNDYTIQIPQIVMVHGKLKSGAVIGEHHSGVSAHERMNYLSLYGSEGTLRVDAMQKIQFAARGEELRPIDVPGDLQRPWQVEQDFVDAVRAAQRGEAWQVSPDFAEGFRYMQKIAAIHLSAERGHRVRPSEL